MCGAVIRYYSSWMTWGWIHFQPMFSLIKLRWLRWKGDLWLDLWAHDWLTSCCESWLYLSGWRDSFMVLLSWSCHSSEFLSSVGWQNRDSLGSEHMVGCVPGHVLFSAVLLLCYGGSYIYIYIYAFSRHFYPKRLTLHSSYSFYILSALAFPGNRTHDLGVASAMLYHLSYRKAVAQSLAVAVVVVIVVFIFGLSVKPV